MSSGLGGAAIPTNDRRNTSCAISSSSGSFSTRMSWPTTAKLPESGGPHLRLVPGLFRQQEADGEGEHGQAQGEQHRGAGRGDVPARRQRGSRADLVESE